VRQIRSSRCGEEGELLDAAVAHAVAKRGD
jgi:hypothetical protein